MNNTLDYYEKNADYFAVETQSVDFEAMQECFLKYIPKAGIILDFGCGSGRDTKYFLEKGFRVDVVDGSKSLCRIATENTGIAVRQMLFRNLTQIQLRILSRGCVTLDIRAKGSMAVGIGFPKGLD